jgi:hypothetical protein
MAAFHLIIYGRFWVITEGPSKSCGEGVAVCGLILARMEPMRHSQEFTAFTKVVDAVLSVPREEMLRREAEYRKTVDANPHRRGPKRGSKRKPKTASASPDPASS